MHINLPNDVKEWIEIAESFLQETKPWEVEAEMNSGKVPVEIDAKHRQMAIDLGLSGMDMPKKIRNIFCRSWTEVDTRPMPSLNLNLDRSLMFQPQRKKSTVDTLSMERNGM